MSDVRDQKSGPQDTDRNLLTGAVSALRMTFKVSCLPLYLRPRKRRASSPARPWSPRNASTSGWDLKRIPY